MNRKINKKVHYKNLGLIDYKDAWDYQEKLFAGITQTKLRNRDRNPDDLSETDNYLIFCQHPHVYTLGKSGDEANMLLDKSGLEEKEATFYHINRGGDITYHGPGQLVGYPILDLDNFFTDIHKYLRYIEEAIILTCKDYGIEAGRIEGLTGVWLDHINKKNPRKICAIGVKASRWVTMHGFAFNVNSNLDYFKYIVPCGIDDKAVTSLKAELKQDVDFSKVEEKVLSHLGTLFEMELFQ